MDKVNKGLGGVGSVDIGAGTAAKSLKIMSRGKPTYEPLRFCKLLMARPSPIPFPLSSFPGANPQEGAGRLINCYAEPLGEASKPSAPAPVVWRGSAGLSQACDHASNRLPRRLVWSRICRMRCFSIPP